MKRNDLLRQKGLIYATKIINLENKIKVLQKQLQTRHIENRNIKRKNGKFEVNAIELYKKMKSNKRLHTYRLYKQIARTQLFDTNFYIEQYTHTKTNAKRAIWDYIQNGVLENRKPNTFFNPQFYLSENIDVALSGMEPLLHYALFGWKEGRNPSTKFDTKKYLVNHPDVARSGMNPLLHYLKYGREENRKVYNVHNATVPISSETFSSPSVVFPQNEESTGSCILNDVVFSSIRRFHGLSPIIQRERLDLVVLNESNFFEVLPFITQRKGKLIVELEIETNSPGLINLQYITVNDQKYNASKCLTKKLSESANSVRFELGTKYLTGLQRINLSKLSGKVSIKRITQSFIENVDESTDPIMSFIVPCYNHGEYLEETINSIRAIEEDELYEIIVVDDGSTDLHTKQVFNKLQNDGITILAQPNKGLGAARNNGISLARGKYIFPVDADNRIRTVHFYRAVEIMETDETVGVVYGDVQFFGTKKYLNRVPEFELKQQFIQNKIDACAVYRKCIWEEVGGYEEHMIGYQDWDFWTSVGVLTKYKFYHMHEAGFEYRTSDHSMVSNTVMYHNEILNFIISKHSGAVRREFKKMYPVVDQSVSPTDMKRIISSYNSNGKPLVSVIVPNYNKESFLPIRLNSIFKQTYRNFEVILLDDASTDESITVIEKYRKRSDKVAHVEYNDKNSGGVFYQWEKGLKHAKGELIWIAEADDYADTAFLERIIPNLNDALNVKIGYAQSHFINSEGDIFGNHINVLQGLDARLWKDNFIHPGRQYVKKFMRRMNVLPNASGIVFSKSLLKDIDWSEIQSFSVCGDWMLWTQLLHKTNIYFHADSLNYFRFHKDTMRSKKSKDLTRIHEHLRVLNYINDHFHLTNEQLEDAVSGFLKGLKKHLIENGHERNELLNLLFDLKKISNNLSIAIAKQGQNNAG